MAIHPVAQGIFWLALALLLVAVGALLSRSLVRRWYGDEVGDSPGPSELLTNFQELHSRGGLSDEEYRTIKTKLATQLQADMGVLAGGLPAEESPAAEPPAANEATSRENASAAGDEGQGAL